MPKSKEVDTLATELKKLKDKGIENPFVCSDLAKWVPSWCDEASRAEGEDSSDDEAGDKTALQEIAHALKGTKRRKVCVCSQARVYPGGS